MFWPEKRKMRLLCASALLGYLLTAMTLWGGQSRLIFEPEKSMTRSATDFSFPIVETAIQVASQRGKAQAVYGWWMPARNSDAKVVLYLHGNDGNVSTSV